MSRAQPELQSDEFQFDGDEFCVNGIYQALRMVYADQNRDTGQGAQFQN
jgi:hypothetical protein